MLLEEVKINRGYYSGRDVPPLKGEVTFKHNKNKLMIELNEDLSKRIVAICADAIVDASKAAAENMTAEIITGQAAITSGDK